MSDFLKLMKFLKSAVKSKILYKLIEYRSKSHSNPEAFDWNWAETHFNRIALVNHLIANTKGWDSNYLEIGCAGNSLFDSVATKRKVGVDPAEGGTHRELSDDFFQRNKEKFDVIFIDGLHHYQQVRRDTLNALESLEDGGWIAFHDFLPASWKEHHVPRLQTAWTGDCWKVAVELTQAKGVDFKILEIDNGVGLLRKTSSDWNIPDMSKDLLNAEFDIFVEKIKTFPIINFEQAVSFIKLRTA